MSNQQIIEQLSTMSTKELWALFRDEYEDGNIDKQTYRDVKWGLEYVPFDFVFYMNYDDKADTVDSWVVDLPATGRKKIGKLKYHIHDVLEEVDRRMSLMRRTLKDLYSHEENETVGRLT